MSSTRPEEAAPHRVYWGSHGCSLRLGHDGPCVCDCCDCPDHDRDQGRRYDDEDEYGNAMGEWWCVARPPYYGPDTNFYGEDAPVKGQDVSEHSCAKCAAGNPFPRGTFLHDRQEMALAGHRLLWVLVDTLRPVINAARLRRRQ